MKEDSGTRAANLVALHGNGAVPLAVEAMRRHAVSGDRRQAHEWGTVLGHVRRLLATGGGETFAGMGTGKGVANPLGREDRSVPAEPAASRDTSS